MKFAFLLMALLILPHADAQTKNGETPLLAQGQMVPPTIGAGQGADIKVKLHLPPGYHAYSNMFRVELPKASNFKMGKFEITPQQEFFDETSKKTKVGIADDAFLTVPVEAPPILQDEVSPLILRLTYQACTKSYCLFPTTVDVPVEFKSLLGAKSTSILLPTAASVGSALPTNDFLSEGNLAFSFLMIFVAGFLTSLTPCIFPMIPITMAIIGREAHSRSRRKTFLVSVIYVLGLALTYASLGVLAASTGALFGSFMNSPWVLGIVCLVFLAMALSMFDLFSLELPTQLQTRLSQSSTQGFIGILIAGGVSGLVAGPCVGPVLVAILTFVAQSKNLWLGFWALFVFALGMGQLFLALGFFSTGLKHLPRSGPWMEGVKHLFGLLLLGAFYFYLNLLIPHRFWEGAFGIGFILFASLKGAFDSNPQTSWQRVRKGLCYGLLLVGLGFILNSVFDLRNLMAPRMISEQSQLDDKQWKPYADSDLQDARKLRRPVIIDFAADWCAACKELEQFTFIDAGFQNETRNVTLLSFNATNDSPQLKVLKERYKIVGLPTLIMIDAQGQWHPELTLTEFAEAPILIERVRSLKKF